MFKSFFCKHEWENYSWFYVKCKNCDKTKHNPILAKRLISQFSSEMVQAGHWDQKEVDKQMFFKFN